MLFSITKKIQPVLLILLLAAPATPLLAQSFSDNQLNNQAPQQDRFAFSDQSQDQDQDQDRNRDHRPPPPPREDGQHPRSGRPNAGPNGNSFDSPPNHQGRNRNRNDANRSNRRPNFDRGRKTALSEQDIATALEIVREYNPEMATRLEKLSKQNPTFAAKLVTRRLPWLGHLLQTKKTDPVRYELMLKDFKLGQQCKTLAKQYKASATKDDAQLQVLKQTVQDHFKVRQTLREMEVKKLQEKVDKLKKQLNARQQAQDQLVKKRLAELVGPTENAKW